MKVLVVEDYAPLRDALARGLRTAGYAVDVAADGLEGLSLALDREYDLVILDLMLPRMDGLTVLERIRGRARRTAVLLLTARDGVDDRVQGLDRGADDYLVKPFAFEELLARVRALLRRNHENRNPVLAVAGLTIDTVARTVARSGQPIDLTAREYALLEFLALRQGRPVARTAIWENLYESTADLQSNVVDVYVGYLRRKLEAGGHPRLIHTRRGYGYVFAEEPPCE